MPIFNKIKVEIIGTDINSEVIDIAKAGKYHKKSFRSVDESFMSNFNHDGHTYTIKDDIKEITTLEDLLKLDLFKKEKAVFQGIFLGFIPFAAQIIMNMIY